MKKTTSIPFSLLLFSSTFLFPQLSHAAGLTNGDFETGDFSGWSLDTDGFAGGFPDFQIENNGGNSSARIEADYWSTSGDTFSTPQDFVFFANTLYQDVDFTANPTDQLRLSFDWSFGGELSSGFDEYFLVGLGDGTGNYYGADGGLGFLMEQLSYGSGNSSFLLDSSFINSTGWTLEFQLASGFDGYGSFLNIDNVTLEAVPTTVAAVPVPGAIWLFSSGLLALVSRKINTKS